MSFAWFADPSGRRSAACSAWLRSARRAPGPTHRPHGQCGRGWRRTRPGTQPPSRLSHSSSDGVNGRGAEEITGAGFGDDVGAEADVVPPVFVEEFAMLLRERVKASRRTAQLPHFDGARSTWSPRRRRRRGSRCGPEGSRACYRGRHDRPRGRVTSGLDLPVKRRLESEAVEAPRPGVPDRIRLHDRQRHVESLASAISRRMASGMRWMPPVSSTRTETSSGRRPRTRLTGPRGAGVSSTTEAPRCAGPRSGVAGQWPGDESEDELSEELARPS